LPEPGSPGIRKRRRTGCTTPPSARRPAHPPPADEPDGAPSPRGHRRDGAGEVLEELLNWILYMDWLWSEAALARAPRSLPSRPREVLRAQCAGGQQGEGAAIHHGLSMSTQVMATTTGATSARLGSPAAATAWTSSVSATPAWSVCVPAGRGAGAFGLRRYRKFVRPCSTADTSRAVNSCRNPDPFGGYRSGPPVCDAASANAALWGA